MLEKYFIEHCTSTMASLKCASLFNCTFQDVAQLENDIAKWNVSFEQKGIRLFVLRRKASSALVYMYRPEKLKNRLENRDIISFLREYGYSDMSVDKVLERLSARIALTDGFPHEIGIMLGYPLNDVKGFITHKGENCKFTGPWKVYGDEHEARRLFAKFRKCKTVYKELYGRGRSVLQLTVAA